MGEIVFILNNFNRIYNKFFRQILYNGERTLFGEFILVLNGVEKLTTGMNNTLFVKCKIFEYFFTLFNLKLFRRRRNNSNWEIYKKYNF